MIIAREKKQKNIVEYVLYMWQVEDLIRGFDFDINKLEEQVISQFDVDEDTRKAMRQWYESLIETMKNEGVEEKGHIQVLRSVVRDLTDMHIRLMRSPFHQDYHQVFEQAMPYLAEYLNRATARDKSIIEVALEVMYGIWMLRLKRQPVSAETQQAVDKISDFLSLLAYKYHKFETDEEFEL